MRLSVFVLTALLHGAVFSIPAHAGRWHTSGAGNTSYQQVDPGDQSASDADSGVDPEILKQRLSDAVDISQRLGIPADQQKAFINRAMDFFQKRGLLVDDPQISEQDMADFYKSVAKMKPTEDEIVEAEDFVREKKSERAPKKKGEDSGDLSSNSPDAPTTERGSFSTTQTTAVADKPSQSKSTATPANVGVPTPPALPQSGYAVPESALTASPGFFAGKSPEGVSSNRNLASNRAPTESAVSEAKGRNRSPFASAGVSAAASANQPAQLQQAATTLQRVGTQSSASGIGNNGASTGSLGSPSSNGGINNPITNTPLTSVGLTIASEGSKATNTLTVNEKPATPPPSGLPSDVREESLGALASLQSPKTPFEKKEMGSIKPAPKSLVSRLMSFFSRAFRGTDSGEISDDPSEQIAMMESENRQDAAAELDGDGARDSWLGTLSFLQGMLLAGFLASGVGYGYYTFKTPETRSSTKKKTG